MKKKGYCIILSIIILLGISLWGYLQYQKKQSHKAGIYNHAHTLVKIDTYEILKKAITNQPNILDSVTVIKKIIKAVEIPANIFIYNVEGKDKSTFFGSLKITDYTFFENYTEPGLERKDIDSHTKLFMDKDHKWAIMYNQTTAVFAYTYKEEKVIGIMQEIIHNKNIIPVEDSKFKDIINKKGLVVFYDGKNEANLNLEGTKISGTIQIETNKIKIPATIVSPDFNKENILSFWLQADVKSFIPHKIFTIDKYQINTDSLLSSFQNEIQLEITKPVIQKESIITYDFDDNFEKIEIVKTKETLTPGLSLQIKSKTNQLYQYLDKQKIIINNEEVNRKVFPLYQVYVGKSKEALVFSTQKKPKFAPQVPSNIIFYLKIDFDKMKKEKEYSTLSKYIQKFQNLEMKARSSNNKITCDWQFNFSNNNEYPLETLIDFIKIVNNPKFENNKD
ncbi:hypothetical protein ETU09_06520 [Apibacter muscae]|uniref:Uncharacterized protein n=1 Tax=Apibacter muscae TaxID=2509004 RepID=A0A563DC02_9FLAO|nr:hypothetical protein [Apibacter muscae]TWP27746.1 hypothetical protein ETU09_06520 [Apibacter muscae]